MCTNPSWWTPTSTKAPNWATLVTTPSRIMPGFRFSSFSSPSRNVAVLKAGRGSRPGFSNSRKVSVTVLIECVEALLGAPGYSALAMPAVYSSEASARFIPVYDELAGRHGKIICSAWQSEWRDGPGAREREQVRNIALFPTMSSCFAALAAANWRAARQAERGPEPRRLAPSSAKDAAARLIAGAVAPALTEGEAKAALALC